MEAEREKKAADPAIDAPITKADRTADSLEARLDTGMTVAEAITRAAIWWESKGRAMMRDRNLSKDNPAFGFFNPAPKTPEEAFNSLPSGIMAGAPWDMLTREDKLQITKIWHHLAIRLEDFGPVN